MMDDRNFSMEKIKDIIIAEKIVWRSHILLRMQQRNIKINDILESIASGEIIEYYNDDYPFPSCLILGFSNRQMPLHVVCAIGEDKIWMITAYRPNNQEWNEDLRTRK